jgi:uncharacterized protein YndB with AHSA1/START domain
MTAGKQVHAVADVEKGLVLATVEIAAKPERVFEALVSQQDVLRWWGSDDSHRTTEWEADVRPGGKWRAAGKSKTGQVYSIEGVFTEVAPPHKLVFTWRPDWDAPHETTVTYLLEPLDEGTRLTLRHEGFAERTPMSHAHRGGWEQVLSWLQSYLRPQAPAAHYFLFKLVPPRTTFIADATPEELAVMQEHSLYWRGKIAEGKAIALGPVVDPAGVWGVGIVRAASQAEADALILNDPCALADKGFRFEVFPMASAIHV